MTLGVRTRAHLDQVVNDYLLFDEFVVDVETRGPYRGDPHRNDVFWISLAGPGRADVIPCGHPLGERIIYPEGETQRRVSPTGKHQTRKINPETGREKWFDTPEPFTKAPDQLWISEVIMALKPLFFSGSRIVGQNVKFDLESLAKYFGEMPPGPYGDTLVAAKLINENFNAYDLGSQVKRAFSYEYDKIGKRGVELFPYSQAHLYSYLDAKYTWLLWEGYKGEMAAQDVVHIFDLEMELLPVLMDMEVTGIPVDMGTLEALGDEFLMEMARIQLTIDQTAGKPVNLNANAQVAELVYDKLGHTCMAFTPTGQRSTRAEELERFVKDDVVAKIIDHAKLNKLYGSFIEGIRDHEDDGRLHPSFNQVGAVSGRISCREPNIQQIPSRSERGKRVRDVFVASPGHVLVVSDLSQIELRVLAHVTQDPVLLNAYRNNIDLHGALAERIFGPDYTPLQRTLAKNTHFSVLFGAGPGTMVRKYQVPNEKMARQLLDGFYNTYKRVKPWKAEILDDARSHYKKGKTPPYVTTILGRKRRLPKLYYQDNGERGGAERQAVSVTISGSAADVFKVIMVNTYNELKKQPWEAHILMTVHDELIVEVPKEHAEAGLALVVRTMENVMGADGKPMLSVPVIADAKIVERWSDAK